MFRPFITTLVALVLAISVSAQERPGVLPQRIQTRLLAEGYLPEDIADLVMRDDYRTGHNGMRHTFLRQRWQGVEVWNGDIALHADAGGNIIQLNNGTWSRLAKRVNTTVPIVTPSAALATVLRADGQPMTEPGVVSSDAQLHETVFEGSSFDGEPVRVRLVLQPMKERLMLAWNVNYYQPGGAHWWNVRVDALSGEVLERNDWVSDCGFDRALASKGADRPDAPPAPAVANDLNVYPWPVESPNHGARVLRNAPWTAGGIASPYGWYDTNGAAGAEYTITRGNNVLAQEDANGNNGTGASPSGGATLDFDFPLDLTQAPSTYQNAALTNLFYWNNLMHDVWYKYGFNEAAGNFQSNNYGRGGTGNDYVLADGQDGSGTNNANFGTPAEGSSPRMQMYLWTTATPMRDGDLDNGIIAHEYTHGISNRLVGGPSNVNCLNNAEQMGEGWSDWFALMMTIEPGDQGTDPRGVGTYAIAQPVTGGGIRPAPYCTALGVNSFTYASTNSMTDVHDIGFVWCSMLWELTWELVSHYGLDPDIYNGTGGNNIAMQLVIDGLKLTPCSPGFVDARNAILQADMADYGGANQNYIWAAFAKRGLGQGASQGSSSSVTDQIEAYNTPMPNDLGVMGILEPVTGTLFDCNSTPLTVRISVRNSGSTAQTSFPISYQLDAGPIVTESYGGTLASGALATYSFSTPLVVSGIGSHTLKVFTGLAGDQVPGNDMTTTSLTVVNGTSSAMPFQENVTSGVAAPSGWTLQNPDNATTWTTATVTNGAGCASTAAWSFDNYSYNAVGQEDRLLTPMIPLGGAAGTHLLFDHAYAQYSSTYSDGLRVDVSVNCGGNWTTVYSASGAALATAAATTSAYVPSACAQWAHHDIDLSAYDGRTILVRFTNINDYGNYLYLDNVALTQSGLKLAVKLMLEGPYDGNAGRMRDDLRSASLIPATEPYTALGFIQASDGGGETLIPAALTTTGDNAIVDWVMVELRNAASPATIIATRAALVQRDGDVVDIDGSSSLALLAPVGSYVVAVRHRNHLGCMLSTPANLSTTLLSGIDFTSASTPVFGSGARKDVNGVQVLWAGNVLRDQQLLYTGAGNDRDPILVNVGSSAPNNTTTGYRTEDVNMDGVVKYTGPGNDRDPILQNIGGSTPNNTRAEQIP